MQGYGNQMQGGFGQQLQGQVGPNAFTSALKGNIADDANLLKQQNLGSIDGRAAAAGMSGSTGYGDQVTKMQNNVDQNALNQMSQLDFNSTQQGMANQMQLAGMQDMSQANAMGQMGQMQQGAMSQFNPYMAQLNATNMYQQSLGPIANEGFSNSSGGGSNSSSSNNFSNGLNVGVNLGGGATNGGSAGGSASNSNSQGGSLGWA